MSLTNSLAIAGSGLLELVNRAACGLYRTGLRRATRVAVPVISVGNITCGGTGKTPLVAALARHLQAAGARPAILTRGYRRTTQEPRLIWHQPAVSWQEAGDEPALLARALPEVPIVVDPDRARGAARAIAATGATHLLLDDGFQHWRLARDIDIVTVDAADPLGALVPRREGPEALARANGIVITRAADRAQALAAMAVLGGWAPTAVFVATALEAVALHRGDSRLPLAALAGTSVFAMAGLANPASFVNALGDLGAAVADLELFPDHYRYRRRDLERVIARAAAAGAEIVTTAKDIVKVPADLAGRFCWLEVAARPIWGDFADLLRSESRPSPGEDLPAPSVSGPALS